MISSLPWGLCVVVFISSVGAPQSLMAQSKTGTKNKKAQTFVTDYLEFTIPKGWACELENTVWSCRYKLPKKCFKSKTKNCLAARKLYSEAIMILTAKKTGPKDSLRQFYRKLNQPFPLLLETSKGKKKKLLSKVVHTKKPKIKAQIWVDSLHMGSELPNYYTRYLATVKNNTSVIITFSSHKKHYAKYSKTFFETMKTLKVKGGSNIKSPLPQSHSLLSPKVGTITHLAKNLCQNSNDPTCEAPDLNLSETPEPSFFGDRQTKRKTLIGAAFLLILLGLAIYKRSLS